MSKETILQEINLAKEEIDGLIELFKSGGLNEPRKFHILLDTAQTDFALDYSGNFFYVIEGSAAAQIDIKVNQIGASALTYTKGLGWKRPIERLFLTWTAQAGKSIDIVIGSYAGKFFEIIDNRSETQTVTSLESILEQLQGLTSGTYNQATIGTTQASVLASYTARISCIVQADPSNSGIIYIGLDNTVASNKCVVALQAGQSFMIDDYRGAIHAIADTAGQKLNYGEF